MHDEGLVLEVLVLDDARSRPASGWPAGTASTMDSRYSRCESKTSLSKGGRGQAQVQFAGLQALDLLAGHQFLQVDVDVGQDRRDLLQQRAQDAEAAGRGEADPQKARAAGGDPPGGDGRALGQRHQPAGLLQEGVAGGVSCTFRLSRSSSSAPTVFSSFWICRLSGGWVMLRRSAARPK